MPLIFSWLRKTPPDFQKIVDIAKGAVYNTTIDRQCRFNEAFPAASSGNGYEDRIIDQLPIGEIINGR